MYASYHAKYSAWPNEQPSAGPAMTGTSRVSVVAQLIATFERMRILTAQVHVPEFLSLDVTMQQAKALHLVQSDPGIRMSALAARLGVGLSTVSGNIDRLTEMGLVSRHDDPADRRQVVVMLTDRGQEVIERFQDLGAQLMRDLLEALDDTELHSLQRGVAGLVRALEQRQAAATPAEAAGSAPDSR
jgi:DNA-binding MarR family transcriptional regulator